MKARKRKIGFFSGIFGILALVSAVAGIWLALSSRNASPVLVSQPESARVQVQTMFDALCAGDYETVSGCLYGTPDLGMSGQAADPVGQLLWEALEDSFAYRIPGDFYATDSGVALDVTVSAMDMDSVTANLRERSREVMEQRMETVENMDEIYDENNEYREDFVMDCLQTAVRDALAEDAQTITWELTLNLIFENGQWWVMPEQELLTALSGGILG